MSFNSYHEQHNSCRGCAKTRVERNPDSVCPHNRTCEFLWPVLFWFPPCLCREFTILEKFVWIVPSSCSRYPAYEHRRGAMSMSLGFVTDSRGEGNASEMKITRSHVATSVARFSLLLNHTQQTALLSQQLSVCLSPATAAVTSNFPRLKIDSSHFFIQLRKSLRIITVF